jgi:hypothetical protein
MKLLTQTLPQVRQVLRQGGWFSPALIVAIFALEFFGRQSANDFYDALWAAVLLLLVAFVAIRHRAAPLGWVRYLGRQGAKLAHVAEHFKIDFGPDLRGTPPIPRRLPVSVYLTIGAFVTWGAAAILAWLYLPGSWRSYLVNGSYIVYLTGMVALWGLLFAGALGGVYFPFMLFNYVCPRAATGPDDTKMSRGQLAFLITYGLAVVVASKLLPLWTGLACGAAVVLTVTLLALWPRRPDVQFIWRGTRDKRVWSVTTPKLLWITTTVVTLMLTSLVLTAAGGRILGRSGNDGDMPITFVLGAAVVWLMPGILLSAGAFVILLWKQNPSRPCRPSAHVAGDLAVAVQPQVTRLFRSWIWNVSFDTQQPTEVDVRLRLVEPRHSQAREFDPEWPLHVSLEDLEDGSVRERFERRDEIQKRRLLLRGLEKIFRQAKSRTFAGGTGFWLAPHLWFMPGLARDEVEDDRDDAGFLAQTVGPPFGDVMHRHVRQYFYRMLRALQVDLIFVEDGIDFRKLKKVLRVLFEVFDKTAGAKAAEEVHFLGLPKVKVMIHDFRLDEPFRSDVYPEPRFEDLGRARILHAFRDRGEQEEYTEPPYDFSRTPVPLLV